MYDCVIYEAIYSQAGGMNRFVVYTTEKTRLNLFFRRGRVHALEICSLLNIIGFDHFSALFVRQLSKAICRCHGVQVPENYRPELLSNFYVLSSCGANFSSLPIGSIAVPIAAGSLGNWISAPSMKD